MSYQIMPFTKQGESPLKRRGPEGKFAVVQVVVEFCRSCTVIILKVSAGTFTLLLHI